MKTKLFSALLVVVALTWLGCATAPDVENLPEDGKAVRVEKEARPLYQAAEQAFDGKNYTDARRLFTQLRTRYPKGAGAMLASYRLGSIAYLEQDYVGAAREFEAYLQKYPRSSMAFDVTYNLAAAEYQLGKYDKAQATLRRLAPAAIQAQDPQRADVVYQLAGQISGSLGDSVQAATQYAKAAGLRTDDARRRVAAEQFEYHLGRLLDRGQLASLEGLVEEPSLRARVSQRIAAIDQGPARETAVAPSTDTAPTPSTERMERLLRSSTGERFAVGVVLPLSGSQAPFGKRALEGILLAAGVYGGNVDGASPIRIFVEDSGGTPVSAAQAVERLVTQRKVMAILGPISWKEAVAVAEKSQDLGVPNVSLATRDGISERGPFLFQNGLTPRVQLESLVQHCVSIRGMKRFAILAPNDTFGRELSSQFWDLVESYGGKVVGFEQYPSGAGDFQQQVRSLVGLADVTRYRAMEAGRLATYVNQQAKKRGGKAPRLELPSIVDFDALFIPDEPKQVAQIASALNYFYVSGVPLLGTTEWNNDQLFKRGGRLVEGAIFPGIAQARPGRRDFGRLYTDGFGYAPDSLAGQAYEAMELVGAAMRVSTADRAELAQRLAAMKDYESALGTLSFDERRLAKRRLPVLGLGPNGTISELR